MAHDYVKDNLQIESQTGKISLEIMATLFGGILLVASFVAGLVFTDDFYPRTLGFFAAILLGAPLVWVAVKDLLRGHAHMNELVALAVIAAIGQGWYQEAGAIAFFMIISVLIETRTALGAQASIELLVRITPTRAQRVTPGVPGVPGVPGTAAAGETETEVEARDLRPGDVVRVRPGDNIPADGAVRRGASTVNQANITGESLPADKNEGDEVFGGTINLTGVLDITVTKAGADTTLGKVKDLILQAERTRTPILRMIDRYAAWYTPTMLMLVGIVLFFSFKSDLANPWERAISMLVIACPCALILATPTAMVASLSAAARLGVLVKSVVDLEAARNLTAMIFDKTGTLTTGQLEVKSLSPMPGVEAADLLRAAASAEQNSRHPVARAVTDVARKARLHLAQPEAFEEVSGRGVVATIGGRKVMVGRANWLTGDGREEKSEERGARSAEAKSEERRAKSQGEASGPADAISALLGIPETRNSKPSGGETRNSLLSADSVAAVRQIQASPDAEGLSVLFVVRDGQLLGWIGLADLTRPEAAAAMDKLRDLGLKRLFIVTGDRESVAKRVAAQMHTEYRAEVLPHQKLEMVDELKGKGHKVAVIGDGVNDAPALAAGDISIAMGAAGSDVAIHSANIALMNNNLNRIPFLIGLSRRTSAVVTQNLAIGIGFIVVFESLAAANLLGGTHAPIVAAVLHVVSGLVVIFNSARLVRSGEDIEQAEAAALAKAQAPARRPAPPPPAPEPVAAPA